MRAIVPIAEVRAACSHVWMANSFKQLHFSARRVVLGGLVVAGGGAATVVAAMVLGVDPTKHAIGVAVVAQIIGLMALVYFLRRWARQDRETTSEATKVFD